VTQVTAVPNIGTVLDRLRYASDVSANLGLFKATVGGVEQIRAWWPELGRIGPNEYTSYDSITRNYLWVVHGVLGFKDTDDTDKKFEELIEAVMNTLDDHKDFSLANVRDYSIGPSFCRLIEPRQWGSVLAHHCEIELPVEIVRAVAFGS